VKPHKTITNCSSCVKIDFATRLDFLKRGQINAPAISNGQGVAMTSTARKFWLRMQRAPGDNLPIILSVIGIVLIMISGWLGGELVYVRGVAVKQPPDQSI
jgi:hypothetical protein